MRVSWTTFKGFVDDRSLSVQWIDENDHYYLTAVDGPYILHHTITKTSPASSDQTDFENNYKSSGNAKVDLNTYAGGDLNVTTELAQLDLSSGSLPVEAEITNVVTTCPTLTGSKWRTEQSTTDVTLSTGSYTTLKTLSNGTLHSVVLDFSSDRVDVRFNIDGQDIFTVDLDDLEDIQVSGSSSSGNGNAGGSGIMYVKTGSKFCFNTPCGLKYSSLTISAKGESNNRKLSGYLIHYSLD